jgi:hypothetical protein
MSDYTETDALKAALDVAARKGGRQPAWLRGALQPRQPERTEPEAARLTGMDLINALHAPEATDDDEPDDDLPAAA